MDIEYVFSEKYHRACMAMATYNLGSSVTKDATLNTQLLLK